MGMPPAEVARGGLARLLVTGTPTTRLGQVDAAGVFFGGGCRVGGALPSSPNLSVHRSRERCFGGRCAAATPSSRRHPRHAVKPAAATGVCRYLQPKPGETKPSHRDILKPNRPGLVIARAAYAGRRERLIQRWVQQFRAYKGGAGTRG